MSTTRYKVRYIDSLGSYGEPRERYLYVNDHHTSGVTTVYNEEGEVVYSWTDDSDGEADALVRIIRGECDESEVWSWEEGGPKSITRAATSTKEG